MKDYLVVEVETKHNGISNEYAQIDAEHWDAMTAEQRYTWLMDEVWHEMLGRVYSVRIYGSSVDGWQRVRSFCSSINMTFAELQEADVLVEQWEARGYLSEEDMKEQEGWDEEEYEEA